MAPKSTSSAARRRSSKQRAPIAIARVPAGVAWLESDRYDRRAFSDLVRAAPAFGELAAAGEHLAPHFAALLEDLFFALFKYNVVWLAPDAVRRSAFLNRMILEQLLPTPAFEALKSRTALEEDKAAIATLVLGGQVLDMLRAEKLLNRRELLDLWDLEHQEQELEARAVALEALEKIEPNEAESRGNSPAAEPPAEPPAEFDKAMEQRRRRLREAGERAAKVSEARLVQKARRIAEQLGQSDLRELKRMQMQSIELAGEIDRVAQDAHDFSLEFGQGGRRSAGERLELGRRLARNKKLGELARLVGRFKQDARALRRKTLDRGAAETYDIERGSELGRLIGSELLAMHQPALARDFRRRLLEGQLLQYRLRADEQKGKGPMVVCIDVSSSMEGDKELWAKAVSLTLMDIARRQRRLFRAVLFSSGDTLKVVDLNRERRYQPELEKVLEMAEYFPGGGTDFQAPLDAALSLLREKSLKRADIVIITDGEAQVAPEWLAALDQTRRELQFSIFAVLVDIGSSERSTLARLSDRITSVSQLTSEGAREIFLSV